MYIKAFLLQDILVFYAFLENYWEIFFEFFFFHEFLMCSVVRLHRLWFRHYFPSLTDVSINNLKI